MIDHAFLPNNLAVMDNERCHCKSVISFKKEKIIVSETINTAIIYALLINVQNCKQDEITVGVIKYFFDIEIMNKYSLLLSQ